MRRILLFIASSIHASALRHVIELSGRTLEYSQDADDAVERACTVQPDIVILEYVPPDRQAIDITQRLTRQLPRSRCIVVSSSPSHRTVLAAMRAGACDFLSLPVSRAEFSTCLERVVTAPLRYGMLAPPASREYGDCYAISRLVKKIAAFLPTQGDRTTLKDFGLAVGVSAGTLRNWCRTAQIPTRSFVNFCRALRAVHHRENNHLLTSENLLNIVDSRTLSRFCRLSGGTSAQLPRTTAELLAKQQFVHDQRIIRAVQCHCDDMFARRTLPLAVNSDSDHVCGVDAGENLACIRLGPRSKLSN